MINIIKWFQDASGLKVNFVKSRLYGISVPLDDVVSMANFIHCSYDKLPLNYLGLRVRKDLSKVNNWFDVIDTFSRHLSSWKSKILSIGGRLTLSKSSPREPSPLLLIFILCPLQGY